MFAVFQDAQYRHRIAIFHFGGHANGYELLLESETGQGAGGWSGCVPGTPARSATGLLNGCSTRKQTQGLLDANVSAVISTSRAIDDAVATEFSRVFYQRLAGGATLRAAFCDAEAAVLTQKGGNHRLRYCVDDTENDADLWSDRLPWDLHLRQGAESGDQWNLPEAAGDPLFGLPPLPKQDLPPSPYRYLNWFTRKHAEVFFGRGHQIRELYDRITASHAAPIILFHGQSPSARQTNATGL